MEQSLSLSGHKQNKLYNGTNKKKNTSPTVKLEV